MAPISPGPTALRLRCPHPRPRLTLSPGPGPFSRFTHEGQRITLCWALGTPELSWLQMEWSLFLVKVNASPPSFKVLLYTSYRLDMSQPCLEPWLSSPGVPLSLSPPSQPVAPGPEPVSQAPASRSTSTLPACGHIFPLLSLCSCRSC